MRFDLRPWIIAMIACVAGMILTAALANRPPAAVYASDAAAATEEGRVWFETVSHERSVEVIRHRATGVCYLRMYDGGLTPLYNADGTLYTIKIGGLENG